MRILFSSSCYGNVSWKWLPAQFIIWLGWEEHIYKESQPFSGWNGNFFSPSLISLWACSAVSAVGTQKRNSVKAPCSPGVFFSPNSLLPSPPFPLMNWHAGRNICYYSHFLTACAAWMGSCSGRKQLSGKRGEIKKREKPPGFFCKGSRTSSYCSLNSELRVQTIEAWQFDTNSWDCFLLTVQFVICPELMENTHRKHVAQSYSDFEEWMCLFTSLAKSPFASSTSAHQHLNNNSWSPSVNTQHIQLQYIWHFPNIQSCSSYIYVEEKTWSRT